MSLKIYSYPQNPRVFKSLIAAKYAGINIETPSFNFPADLQSKEFLAKNPLGKVPVLETPEGPVFESNAILRYVGRKGQASGIYGHNDYQAAVVDQWIDFSVNELELPLNVWTYPILGFLDFNHDATEKAKADVQKALTILNNHLLTHTYLVGEAITIADMAVACVLLRGYKLVFDSKYRKPFANVTRWFRTCVRQPNWAPIVGEVKLCETMAVAKPSEKKPEAAKPAQPAAQAKPTTKPPKDEDDDGEEKEEKKGPNPLDLLPPSKLNLEEWKRYYSNADDTRGDAMNWFWGKYDDQGYSIWLGNYKYNSDLEKELNTVNLMGGFIQRLDGNKLRKWSFGSLVLFGQEPSMEIACCFVFRGHELPAELKDVDDYENYDWKRLDEKNAADKELIEDFFCWSGNFGGKYKPFNQAKIFK